MADNMQDDEDDDNTTNVMPNPIPGVTPGTTASTGPQPTPDGGVQQTDVTTSGNDDSNTQTGPSLQGTVDALKKEVPELSSVPDDKIASGVDKIQQTTGLSYESIVQQGPAFFKTAMGQKVLSQMGNGQTSLTQNANENPTMAAAAAQATTPVMPTSGPGAGQVPLWASGPAGVRYPEQNNAMVQSAVDVQKQNLAGQQQQFNQGTAAQTQAQNNVVFQQNQSVQQALLDPTSPVNVASRQYLASIGINLPDSVSMAQMEKVAPGITEKVLSTSGMQTYNNNMAQTAAAYDANPQGYDTAVGAAGDDLNLVENKIRKLQGNNDWSQRKMAIALTAVSQPNNKDAQLAAAAIDPDYLDIAHTAQVIGANYGMVSGKGTDFGTQTVMNSILNPADPIKSLEVTRAAITSARDNAKNISKEYHKTGGRFGGFTPTTVNPYANVPAEKQKAEVGNNAVGNNTTTPANRINIQDKNGHTFSIPNKPSQIALAQKQGYTIAPGQ